MTKFETIIVEKKEGIATITLNMPQIANSITATMYNELPVAIDEIGGDGESRVLVITGAGKGFCGGGDTGEIGEGGIYTGMKREDIIEKITKTTQKPVLSLLNLEIPTIAMVNGFAAAGGFDIACACDIRIGSEKARFANAFLGVALSPEYGIHYFLPKIVGLGRASEILYTGRWVLAEEAEKIGLLNRMVPLEDLEKETMELARQLAKAAPIALKLTKKLVREAIEVDGAAILRAAAEYQSITLQSEDHNEGVAAWLEKREPVFRGK